jgi:hypothetical protein
VITRTDAQKKDVTLLSLGDSQATDAEQPGCGGSKARPGVELIV